MSLVLELSWNCLNASLAATHIPGKLKMYFPPIKLFTTCVNPLIINSLCDETHKICNSSQNIETATSLFLPKPINYHFL
jgi:hypothetical protein